METGDIGHDVVGTAGFEYGETGGGKNFEKALALFCVGGSESVVVGLRRAQRDGSALLQRRGSTDRKKIVNFADGLRRFRWSDGPADAPAGDTIRLGHAVDDDSAFAHAIKAGPGEGLRTGIENMLVNFLRDAIGAPPHTEIPDQFQVLAGADFARGAVGRAEADGLGERA